MKEKTTKKIAWLSRHKMSEAQASDLAETLGCEPSSLEIEAINLTWSASADLTADGIDNRAEWLRLAREYDVIAGVFPPVALEAMCCHLPAVYTPVSRPRPDLRQGEGPIPFEHLRWSNILPAPYFQIALHDVADNLPHVVTTTARELAAQVLAGFIPRGDW